MSQIENYYFPVGNEVIKTKTGSAITANDSVKFPLLALNLYGKSTQDGTPTPDTPIDIVNVGDSGSVVVTVNDGGENSLSASLTSALPLCGIPVTSGGNYTDSKGQQWICDELIYRPDGTGKVVKKILKRNASDLPFESADISGYSTPPERICFYFNYVGKKTNSTAVICNRFKPGNYKETSEVNIVGAESITLLFGISGEIARSVDALRTWFSQNPTYMLYERATPEEIELTAEEMAQLKALYSYSGVTNISNDAGAEMAVKYCTSTEVEKYITPLIT